ncbi:MAG: single-stranded DNA-binding protein [Planctomycetes bacterium]|nr:single-stranded DNA-binding protein [Planctomycetota bacterium]
MSLARVTQAAVAELDRLRFAPPVACVYDPLDYAWPLHEQWLQRFGQGQKEVLLLGMNPGPFGMVQTGVPFGEIAAVRDFLGLCADVRQPAMAHPKRPIEGLACKRAEVSGRRLWGWVRDRFGTPEAFARRFFVANYCPLAFLGVSGANLTPDKLPKAETAPLFAICDRLLRAVVDEVRPAWVVGVGAFAEARARAVLGDAVRIGRIPHPSPASPAANRGWEKLADEAFAGLGIAVP